MVRKYIALILSQYCVLKCTCVTLSQLRYTCWNFPSARHDNSGTPNSDKSFCSLAQLCALLAVPLALWPVFRCQPHTLKVKPLNSTVLIITSNHLSKRYALTVAVDRFAGIYCCWNACCHAYSTNKSEKRTHSNSTNFAIAEESV